MDAQHAARLEAIRAKYQQDFERRSREADALEVRSQRVGNYRGLSFLTAVVSAGIYLSQGLSWLLLVSGAALLSFVALVKYHSTVVEQEETKRRHALVNQYGLFRTTHKWHSLPRAGLHLMPPAHAYAGDLDLFGNNSLYQRICVAHTRYGQSTLAEWLSAPADDAEIRLRQAAVLELATSSDFRQQFEASGMALVDKGNSATGHLLSESPNPERLLAWAKTREPLLENPLVLGLAFLFPLCSITCMLGQALLDWPPYYWFISVAASLVLLAITKTETSSAFEAVSTTEGAFLRYGELLAQLESHRAKAEWFSIQSQQLAGQDGVRPSVIMSRFRSIVSWYDARHNGMAYPFINAVLLWDIHCSSALHRWKRKSGASLDGWFSVIGQYEALSSLAGLLADDPEATMPEIAAAKGNAASLIAEGMGHPLLACGKRVSNDVAPLELGQALLVTGSNMSGKSTFLRALGVNCVLAFAGGPVIARRLHLPIVHLGTSIRVSDSLSGGISHFYAEVQKLAQVVRLAQDKSRPVLFLLDEVLHGTNSRERQVGARWVLAELLKLGAFGVITTHDMELCRLPADLMTRVRQHHFRELVIDGEMTFDFTLREGPVSSGNALRLMRQVGLDVPLDG